MKRKQYQVNDKPYSYDDADQRGNNQAEENKYCEQETEEEPHDLQLISLAIFPLINLNTGEDPARA